MTRAGASWKPHRFPSGFAAIVHRTHGAVLFDTGYAPRFEAETRRFPERFYRWLTPVTVDTSDSAHAQLARLGIPADRVTAVVVSHFHADHVAGLRDFPAARIVCSRDAWRSIDGLGRVAGVRHGFLRGLIPEDAAARLSFVEDREAIELDRAFAPFERGRDLFGDGSAVAVALPGHAQGQIGMLLPHTGEGPLFLIGDAAWSHAAYERVAPPPAVTTALLGNTARYLDTLQRLAALHRAHPLLRIVPSHAPIAAFATAPGSSHR